MAYTIFNFKTKKALKEALNNYITKTNYLNSHDYEIRCYNPGLGPDLSNYTGKICLEGPHYPKPHTWYALAELVDGVIIKVK